MDAINAKWGGGSLRPAFVMADHSVWEMARGSLSPGYTTDWEVLPVQGLLAGGGFQRLPQAFQSFI
jgi:hypothetical protein